MIFIGPADAPEQSIELVVGTFSVGLRKARLRGVSLYFDTYRERYGFKHPEDPSRTRSDGPLPATVVSLRSDRIPDTTWTRDSDVEVANVR